MRKRSRKPVHIREVEIRPLDGPPSSYVDFLEEQFRRRGAVRLEFGDRPFGKSCGELCPVCNGDFHELCTPDRGAVRIFSVVGLLLPKRIVDEDLCDQLEAVNHMKAIGSPRWQIWLKIFASVIWAFVKAWRLAGQSKSKVSR